MKAWLGRVLIGVDQLVNAVLDGNPDDTLSSRSWKAKARGLWWGKPAVRMIDALFGAGHCERSAEWDEV